MRALLAILAFALIVSPAEARHPRGGGPPVVSLPLFPSVNDVRTNWALAGTTIPTRTTVCSTVSPSGLTSPGSGDDYHLITTAEAACPANEVVQLSAGVFNIFSTESLKLNKSNITLRGTGTCTSAGGGEPPVAYCPTEIRVYDGMLQTYAGNGACGVSGSGTSPCPGANENATIKMGADDGNNLWWAGCAYSVSATGCGYQLTADAAQGATSVQVSATTKLSVGMAMRIDETSGAVSQTNPANNTGGTIASNLFGASDYAGPNTQAATGRIVYAPGSTGVEDGAGYGALYDRPTSEIKIITNIGTACGAGATSLTVCFDSPLTIAFRVSHHAQVYWPTDDNGNSVPFLTGIGIENISIERSTQDPVLIRYCNGCWVKGVETFMWRGGIVVNNSIRVLLAELYVHDCADCENNGEEYPVAFDGATTESLLTDSIIRLAGKGMVGRACGGGNVVSYSYVDDTFYQANVIGNYWIDMGVNGSHYTGCHHMLFEGNEGDTLGDDETHGNEAYHTYFRNWGRSQRTPFTDPSLSVSTSVTHGIATATVNDASGLGYSQFTGHYPTQPAPMRAAGEMMWDYEMAYLGNVLGISGVTTAANGYVYSGCNASVGCTASVGKIWLMGWSGSECGNGGTYCTDPNLNGTNTPQLFFRSGDYDYLTTSIADWASGYSQSIPNSLYLSAKPPFFTGATNTYPWPWVTSQASPYIQTNSASGAGLPAKARFDAGTPFVQP